MYETIKSVEDIGKYTSATHGLLLANGKQNSEIEEVVEILHTIIIYNEDNSYKDYAGQGVIITITKTDGTQMKTIAFNPFFIIDDVGYKTKYEPCEKLNSWANKLINNRLRCKNL